MISVILSGGENSRFPSLKGFIEVEGRTILERTIDILKRAAGEVYICTNAPEVYFRLGAPLIGDVVRFSGPMGGIFSVFLATGADEIFVAACDMPFLKPGLVRFIIEKRQGKATVPVFQGRPEPLLAVYSRTALQAMEDMLQKGQRSLTAMLEGLGDVRYLAEEEVRVRDPEGVSFVNINTPEDYSRAFGKLPEALV